MLLEPKPYTRLTPAAPIVVSRWTYVVALSALMVSLSFFGAYYYHFGVKAV